MTIRELKEYVKDLPEVDVDGEEYEVWLDGTGCKPGLTNECTTIERLNKGDILLGISTQDTPAIEDTIKNIDKKIKELEDRRSNTIIEGLK